MASNSLTLSQLIDDYIVWFVDWHRAPANGAPPRFAQWRSEAIKTLQGEQPAIERIGTLHEQLHTLVKLVTIKQADTGAGDAKDDESITAKYLELMQELRRFERAFAAAESDLDPLTGLRTRIRLRQELEREISRSKRSHRPFFIAVMDIDHFKKINDTHGHAAGDVVLTATANLVSRSLRGQDDVYRIGGEEFLLCLKETDAAGSLLVVERVRKSLEETTIALPDGQNLRVTASFGLKACMGDGTVDDLVRDADEALYRAKHEGRNRVVVAG